MLVNEVELDYLITREISSEIWEVVEEAALIEAEDACGKDEEVLDDEGESFIEKVNNYKITKHDDGTRIVTGIVTVTGTREFGRVELDDWFEQAVTIHVNGVAKAEQEVEFSIEYDRTGQMTNSTVVCCGDVYVRSDAA